MGDTFPLLTGDWILAPSAVVHLPPLQPITRPSHPLTTGICLSDRQRLQCEERAVREAYTPAAEPASIRPLHAPYKACRILDGATDVGGAVGRKASAEDGEAGQHGRRALGVGVFNHAAVKDLSGVEQLNVGAGAGALVAAKTFIGVLHGEQRVDTVLETGSGDKGGKPL